MTAIWKAVFSPVAPSWRNPLLALLWYIFGNAEDGPYARFGGKGLGVDDRFLPIDWKAAAKWWLRNPFHNVFFHLIDWPFTQARTLHGTPNNPDAPFWNTDGRWLVALNGGPFVSYRNGSFQFYAGWRPFNMRGGGRHGVLGVTVRKRG